MAETAFELLIELNFLFVLQKNHKQAWYQLRLSAQAIQMDQYIKRQKPLNARVGVVIHRVREMNGPVKAFTGPLAIKISHNNNVTVAWMGGWTGLASQLINQTVTYTLPNNQLMIPQH